MRCLLSLLAYLASAAHGSRYASAQKPLRARDGVPAALSPLRSLAMLIMRVDSLPAFCPSGPGLRYPAGKFMPTITSLRPALYDQRLHCGHSVPTLNCFKRRMPVMSTGNESSQEMLEAEPSKAKPGIKTAPGFKRFLVTNVGAAVCACFEVAEDLEHVGHGHGMVLLTTSRLCRETNVLREAALSQAEKIEESSLKMAGRIQAAVKKSWKFLLRKLSSTAATMALSLGALAAALNEVFEDVTPGGHHGALLLAVNELLEILESSNIVKGRVLTWMKKRVLRLSLLLGAFVCALLETVTTISEFKLYAHYGVLVLAFSRSLRVIGLMMEETEEAKEE